MDSKRRIKRSIIIPVFNGMAFLEEFWNRLVKHLPIDSEVIIVNDASIEPVEQIFPKNSDQFNIKIISNRVNCGYAYSVNRGVGESKSEYIHVLNTDVFLQNDFFTVNECLIEENEKLGIIGVPLIYPQTFHYQHYGLAFSSRKKHHVYRHCPLNLIPKLDSIEREAITFAAATIQRAIWERLGGLDEGYYNRNEDIDFCLRAKEIGYEIALSPTEHSYHWESVSGTPRFVHDVENESKFWSRWGSKLNPDIGFYLNISLRSSLERYSSLSKTTEFQLVDLTRGFVESDIYLQLKSNIPLKEGKITKHQRFKISKDIHLSMALPCNLAKTNTPLVYLVDEWVLLRENAAWFKERIERVGKELIVDLNANAIWSDEIC